MKLKNKKTGDIVDIADLEFTSDNFAIWLYTTKYNSLAELNEEWEDYEEPETFWYMTAWGDVKEYSQDQFAIKQKQAIGNYFETEEEAEKAVEKLKAWKRLKEARIHFKDYHYELKEDDALITYELEIEADGFAYEDFTDDLKSLFGGEE